MFILCKSSKGAYERNSRTNLSHTLKHVEVNILDSSDIPAAIRELKLIQDEIQAHLSSSVDLERLRIAK